MKLPIKAGDKTVYMDSEEWEREMKWREDAEKAFLSKMWKVLSGK